jgi:ribosomal protein S18 acetylase RimI-like enzyme
LDKQTISINRIGVNHAEQLAELQTLTFTQAYANVHSPEDIEAYCAAQYSAELAADDLISEETVYCVGLLDLEPSGYYVVKHHACPIDLGSDSSELKQIYVLSSVYGSGLGRALYEHSLATIRAAGQQWVWLCVSDINYRAQAFYEKRGFEKIGIGPILEVGKDKLPSSVLALEL